MCPNAGADPGFQVRGGALKKIARAEGGAKIFGVFRVKNHDITPKNHIFPILGNTRNRRVVLFSSILFNTSFIYLHEWVSNCCLKLNEQIFVGAIS
jgi:hypothetical protein